MGKSKVNILMADDDAEDIELIEEAILNIEPEATLHKFLNGHSAIEYLHSAPDDDLPCLIILDYNMPELKGSEVLSFMKSKKRYATIPKVVLSTSNAYMHQHECLNNGASEYIVKPDNMKELLGLAKKLLTYCGRTA
ncbi:MULTISPECIES: response regulator [Niastella]|uniref:Response regulator n=1 Tax=Niastella soli TaxID=2821487 RepID=A0ABS3Z2F9_9BACT|nr:response regulator [Niastella soli]MBO9204338.1 response regulator [Niastella soli]